MLPIPSVSIVVPVYNAQRYLPAAMKSVLAQALADWELIAVNDGSTDRSLRILKWFAAKDARIRVVDCENRGIEKSLNEGIALCAANSLHAWTPTTSSCLIAWGCN